MSDPQAAANSAWAAVKAKFPETPAKGPCIPCAARKKNPVGPKWDKAVKAVFPGQQSFNNCGVQASRQIVEQVRGKLDKSEKEFMDDGIATCSVNQDPDPSKSGASSALSRQCLLQQYGIHSSIEDASIANVDAALRDGKGVIITAESKVLWPMAGEPAGSGGAHAVLVSNGIYNSAGKMTGVEISDTGTGSRYPMSIEDLDTALKSGPGVMNVTDAPIWPSN